jgi:hypothetical protein
MSVHLLLMMTVTGIPLLLLIASAAVILIAGKWPTTRGAWLHIITDVQLAEIEESDTWT